MMLGSGKVDVNQSIDMNDMGDMIVVCIMCMQVNEIRNVKRFGTLKFCRGSTRGSGCWLSYTTCAGCAKKVEKKNMSTTTGMNVNISKDDSKYVENIAILLLHDRMLTCLPMFTSIDVIKSAFRDDTMITHVRAEIDAYGDLSVERLPYMRPSFFW